jgi:hypothetical protein
VVYIRFTLVGFHLWLMIYDLLTYFFQAIENQTSDMSWWPKETTWQRNGLDWGYWTHACETWFQNRLKEIRAGNAQARSASHWNRSLTFQKATPKIVLATRADAERCLARHIV